MTTDSNQAPADGIAQSWLKAFESACAQLAKTSTDSVIPVTDLFLPNGWWKDRICLSWNLRTFEGTDKMAAFLSENRRLAKAGFKNCKIETDTSLGGPALKQVPTPAGTLMEIVEFTFRFDLSSPNGHGRACARLAKVEDTWKAFILFTFLESLTGYEVNNARPLGHYDNHTKIWEDVRAEKFAKIESDPTVLIVGGGQAGLITASHLQKMGINVLIVEKNAAIGDSWRKRYDLLTLHTTMTHLTMPGQPYPSNMPIFIPKTKFADFLQYYALFQELNVWTSTECLPYPTYDSAKREWTVVVSRGGKNVALKPKHLIMSIGWQGEPKIPLFKGMDNFKGELIHTSQFKNAKSWKGKKVVIIGAGVSGTDVALEADVDGAHVTIVQRSPVVFQRISTVKAILDSLWVPGRPVEDSDFLVSATPGNLNLRLAAGVFTPHIRQVEKETHDKLREKGFLVGWGEEEGRGPIGHLGLIMTRGGGFCLDVGCADRIIAGSIKVKSKVEIDHFKADGVVFNDGTELDADVVVLGTGYSGMKPVVAKLLGEKISKQTSEIWNMDEEGEQRGVFKPTGHPRLWFTAGGHNELRTLGRSLALQILGHELGLVGEE